MIGANTAKLWTVVKTTSAAGGQPVSRQLSRTVPSAARPTASST